MKRRTRIYYTAQQIALMWERYQQGTPLNDIARLSIDTTLPFVSLSLSLAVLDLEINTERKLI